MWLFVTGFFSMFSMFIHIIACINISFLLKRMRLNNIPLYRYMTFCLSIHRHLDCFHFLAMKNNVVMNIHVQVFVWTCSHFSWVYM